MWIVEYDNHTGADDVSFFEWWSITDGVKSFETTDEEDARWLCELLKKLEPRPSLGVPNRQQ